ncbi:hypothetical protein JZ751_027036 [Albula glossodonta]|uniref:Uncharacterized protein n=1 Tax=Albula glossodonta TaxID=121402 RepID=A0A8T2NKQ8_9TELE|nr:hypothetical protein JZ751_027036 [Albula glossodonta]
MRQDVEITGFLPWSNSRPVLIVQIYPHLQPSRSIPQCGEPLAAKLNHCSAPKSGTFSDPQ